MLSAFFLSAGRSPSRQKNFRTTLTLHLCFLAALLVVLCYTPTATTMSLVAQTLLCTGITEGAILIGWRLTQIPKSQALEFLLTSPVQPGWVFLAELLVGLYQLMLVQLGGLPFLLAMLFTGQIEPDGILVLMGMTFFWGVVTGLGIIVWTYESRFVRKIGEYVAMAGILIYLVVGVLAGEHLRSWLQAFPHWLGQGIYDLVLRFYQFNPFGIIQYWFSAEFIPWLGWERLEYHLGVTFFLSILMVLRGKVRLLGHFHDRHYRPLESNRLDQSDRIGNQPLSWWAVRRVMEYSGRVNQWLAGGFCLIYATYIVAEPHWPIWMGRLVFQIVDRLGGPAMLITGLLILAAVPAAFQYGLWDANESDRCKRLELLLLSELTGQDYHAAALAAAWRRGRGYLFIAMFLWIALLLAHRIDVLQFLASLAMGAIFWGMVFTIGFRAFSTGVQANRFGSLMTLGLPLLTYAAFRMQYDFLACLLPPGAIFHALTDRPDWLWAIGPISLSLLTLFLEKKSMNSCDANLRDWYNRRHGPAANLI